MGLIIKQNLTNLQRKQLPIQEQLKNLFERDWNSKYAVNLEDVQGQKDCNWGGRLWSELKYKFKIKTKNIFESCSLCKTRSFLLYVFVREIAFSWYPHCLMTRELLIVDSTCKTISQCVTFPFLHDYLIPELMKCIQCYMTSCLIPKQTWKIQPDINTSEMQIAIAVLFCLRKLYISTLMFH